MFLVGAQKNHHIELTCTECKVKLFKMLLWTKRANGHAIGDVGSRQFVLLMIVKLYIKVFCFFILTEYTSTQ